MIASWQEGLLIFFRTVSQILTAGIAITAFALLLYALTFNLRDRVARSFAFIMLCVVVVFSADAIGSTSTVYFEIDFWLRLQWIGILFIPLLISNFPMPCWRPLEDPAGGGVFGLSGSVM
jgi:hypothetical protein